MPTFGPFFGMQGDAVYEARVKGDIVSMMQAGGCVGSILINLAADPFGRRTAIIVCAAVFIIGSVVQVVSPNVAAMMAGRFVGGMGVGACANVVPVYIAEISDKNSRGRMANLWQFMLVIGIMLSYWVDYACLRHLPVGHIQWKTPLGIQIIPGGIMFIGMFFLPESLRWLGSKGKVDEMRKTLSRLRVLPETHEKVSEEIEEILASIEDEKEGKATRWAEMRKPSNVRRLIIGIIIGICQQWTGTNAINYYAPEMVRQLGVTGDSVDILATGIYGAVKVVFVFVFFFMVDHPFFGRRNSLIIGSVIMFISFYILGALLMYIEKEQAVAAAAGITSSVSGKGYAAMVMLFLFAIGYEISWGPLMYVICAEIFPTRIRAICMSITMAIYLAMNAVIAKVTPLMITQLTYGTYFFFGSTVLAMTMFTWLYVPETRGRSLEDMEPIFSGPLIVLRNKEATRRVHLDSGKKNPARDPSDTTSSSNGEDDKLEKVVELKENVTGERHAAAI
ncbi:general substrate transporter [Zychaea mexicana]|uniref:general substrate transporter n=1 Tax=Zychaea mexicana TaxID=64656 RepID=UPI0022FEB3BA|nr:general substrate transporter [Zychaea mexicana]KAI9491191.1 general substrate transporter [Zychaea mexicana]